MFHSKFHTKRTSTDQVDRWRFFAVICYLFLAARREFRFIPVFDCPLDEQLPEQPPQQPAVPLNRPRT